MVVLVNLLAPDLRGEVLILIAPDWQYRMMLPKVDEADRLRLVQLLFDAAQLAAQQWGISVALRKP